MRKSLLLGLMAVLLSFLIGFVFLPHLPEEVPVHWNSQGVADGFAPKLWAVLIAPAVSLGLFGLFAAIPRIDPLKSNIEKFMNYYEGFVVVVMLFMLYIHSVVLGLGMGMRFNIMQAMSPALGVLLFCTGILMEKAKRNWFIGIRTPWTMSNEKVWNRTHELGAKLFKIAGVVAFFGAVFTEYAIWLIAGPIIVASVFLVAYSYFEFQRTTESKHHRQGYKRVRKARRY